MRRPLIAIAAILSAIVPAIAEDATPGAGRYQITPNEAGFTRLDTETGSISHCSKREGTWHCEPLVSSDEALRQKIDTLAGAVAQLSDEVEALAARIEALAGRVDALASRAPATVRSRPAEDAQSADEALNFAEQVMRRFFDLVREMKSADDGDRI